MVRQVLGVATLAFVGLVVALHFLRTDVDPLARGISRYAAGPHGWLATVAFGALIAACLCAAWLLRSAEWAIAAAGMGAVAATPLGLEPSSGGPAYAAHQLGAAVFFCAATTGARRISRVVARAATIALVLFLANVALRGPVLGLLQRILFAAIVASLMTLFWRGGGSARR